MENSNQIAVFEQDKIRHIEHEGETWFSVVDIIELLTESKNPRNYWKVLKNREPQMVTICNQLKILAKDGKKYATDCANTEGVLRIIQSVPSPKAEPFKLWLAQLGKERLQEFESPEIAAQRAKELYKLKGYSDEWIERRLKSIEVRKDLTDEWQKRGIQEGQEYAVLTAEIAKETFGITPSQHKELKGLDKQNLRDHMTTFELIFTMLGEEATRFLAEKDDAQGFEDNREAALKGGRGAGQALKNFEKTTQVKVVSAQNFIQQIEEAAQKNELPPDDSKTNE